MNPNAFDFALGQPQSDQPPQVNSNRESFTIELVRPRREDYAYIGMFYNGVPHAPIKVPRETTLRNIVPSILAIINLEA